VLTNRVVDLIEEEFDLAIRVAEGALDGSLIARKLATSRQVVCASPAYLRRHGMLRVPADLLAHKCLVYGMAGRHEGWVFGRNGKSQRVKVPNVLQCNQLRLLCQAAVEGAGIVLQPTFSGWEQLAAGRLRTLLDDWSAGGPGVFIVFPSRRFLPVKTRLFIDFVADIFRNDPDRDVWIDRARARSGAPGARTTARPTGTAGAGRTSVRK
jgi:DNA-binding transcriptional LysR family regulator